MAKKTEAITGSPTRDTMVVCTALAYAILTIERLPFEYQERSDKEDMKAILESVASKFLGVDYFMDNARRHMDNVPFTDPSNVIKMVDALKNMTK